MPVIELAAAAATKSPSAWDQPGTLGFLVVFGMGVILFFVFRSLAKQLRKVNEAARLEALQSDADAQGPGAQGPGAQQSGAQQSGAQVAGTAFSGAPQADTDGSSLGMPLADSNVIGPPAPNGRAR
jgi:hypothetical protein